MRVEIGLTAVLLTMLAHPAAAQDTLTVNPALASQGERLFTAKGCMACHTVGRGELVGPDLKGVTERRPLDWLRRFITQPSAMLRSDSLAKQLLAQYKNVPMPDLPLRDTEVDALIHYLKRESR